MGSSSKSSKKSDKPKHKDSSSSKKGMSTLERYVVDSQRHEQIAIGKRCDPSSGHDTIRKWEGSWKDASGKR
ncbi:hypothetical protein F5Y18DRAFT_426969 [Xylariaceae sp. FL1019]|nr:hypothetical protein F5Y18DRAFT_426969 [Xylariaceae sp. FL1019]